jgi:hypothetical protein
MMVDSIERATGGECSRSCIVLSCVSFHDEVNDRGIQRADTAQALGWWRHLGALHEATDTLHRLMCIAPYQPSGSMVVAFAVDLLLLTLPSTPCPRQVCKLNMVSMVVLSVMLTCRY